MSHETIVGWDIGGAHVKAAGLDRSGQLRWVLQLPCPLWRGLGHLRQSLKQVLTALPAGCSTRHVVTMTGELVDLFANRAEGVHQIVAVMAESLGDGVVRFYAAGGGLLDAGQAVLDSKRVASANWCASADWAALQLADGLLIDVGSTTTDIVPFSSGAVRNVGRDDFSRMQAEELIYTGVVRTPVCSLADRVPFEGEWLGLAAEHFSTAADVYRLGEALPGDADQHPTPDRASHSIEDSARRLARMIGRDLESADLEQWRELAAYLSGEQLARITRACRRVVSRGGLNRHAPVVGAGVGRFLAARVAQMLGRPYRDFGELCHTEDGGLARRAADCAPAAALAHLCLIDREEQWHASADSTATVPY